MNLTDQLHQITDLHASGVLSDDEFCAAKARLLASHPPTSEDSELHSRHLKRIEAEAALARLDREWVIDRDLYVMAARNNWWNYLGPWLVLVLIFIGLLLVRSHYLSPVTVVSAYIGLLGIGLFTSTRRGNSKRFQEAGARYLQRRAELIADIDLAD